MTNALRRVRPGEPVKIPAAAWNRMIEEVVPRPRFVGSDEAWPHVNHRVRMKNFTTGPLDRWGVLQIDGMLETPTGVTGPAEDSFQSYPGVVGVVPGLASAAAQRAYVVSVEPIAAGEIGQGAIAGVVQARMVVRCTGHRHARPVTNQVAYLESCDVGPFRQLWRGATGTAGATGVWSLLMFGTENDPTTLPGHATGAVQMLGHGKQSSSTGCDGGLQWYSVTECSGTPSYASSYFL
jgi:hypothetical protein